MTLKELVTQQLDSLSDSELTQVAEFVQFLKFRSRSLRHPIPDEAQLAALYRESADEDRALAEEGIDEYADALSKEDNS